MSSGQRQETVRATTHVGSELPGCARNDGTGNESRVLIIEISCRAVWKLISSFIDGDLDPELRTQLEEHLRKCKHCIALVDGTKNVVHLMADERTFELPSGFAERLRKNLAKISR